MLDTIGKRLKCCRAATGKSTHDVVDYIHSKGGEISYATYTRWESDTSIPQKKTQVLLDDVAELFRNNGLYVDVQWILTGDGFPPQFTEYKNLDEDTMFILASKTLPNVELIQVGGEYGEPHVRFGEFCIVSTENSIDKNNNKLCYVRHSNGIKIGVIYVFDETSIVVPGSENLKLKKEDVIECRKIKWIQKK